MQAIKPRFSRRALNIIIFVTAGLILVLSQMGSEDPALQKITGPSLQDKAKELQQGLKSRQQVTQSRSLADYFPELADIPEIPKADIPFDIQHWITDSGLSVYFLRSPGLAIADYRLVFNGGSARDAEMPGLARLTSSLISAGAQSMNASDIADAFDALGAQMSASAYKDMAVVSLRTLSDPQYLDESVSLYGKVLSEMVFSEDDFLRERQRQKVELAHLAQSPSTQSQNALALMLYGEDHPYSHPSIGTEEGIDALHPEDILAFHSAHYVSRNAIFAVVGDLTRGQVEAQAALLGGLLREGKAAPRIPLGTEPVAGRHVHIDFSSEQTHIALVSPGIHRGHQDYFKLFLANHVVGGGGFSSLLNKTIRQEKAFAYAVGSSIMPMAGTGGVMIGMQTRADQAAAAIAATQWVLDDIAANGVDPSILMDAKQQILSEFAMRASSNSSKLGQLASIAFYGLPLDHLAQFNREIESVTVADIQAMVQTYFQNMGVVTVGRFDPLGE